MFRCALLELLSLGGGHALGGSLRRAAGWFAVIAGCVALTFWTPFAAWLMVGLRLTSIVEAARHGRHGPPAGGWRWKPALMFVIVSFGFLVAVRSFALENFRAPSGGMAPTLGVGDFFVTDKLSLRWRGPERGEPVVFRTAGRDFVGRVVAIGGDRVAVRGGFLFLDGTQVPSRDVEPVIVHRLDEPRGTILAMRARARRESLGGHDYRVAHVDHQDPLGQPRQHDYPTEPDGCAAPMAEHGLALTPTDDRQACIVPAGAVFILGDNRDDSADSRHRGAIPAAAVRARVIGVWLSGVGGLRRNLGRTE